MNILAFDTATEALGICLKLEDQKRTLIVEAGPRHSETLLPGVHQLIRESGIKPKDLDLIVCSLGPGSFTGIRIGLATAKGLALGGGCPLVGLSSLDALAHRFRFYSGAVVPLLRHLRKRYYAAFYRQGIRISDFLDLSLAELIQKIEAPAPDLPETPKAFEKILLTGARALDLWEEFKEKNAPDIVLDAGGALTDPERLLEAGLLVFQRKDFKDPQGENLKPLYLKPGPAG